MVKKIPSNRIPTTKKKIPSSKFPKSKKRPSRKFGKAPKAASERSIAPALSDRPTNEAERQERIAALKEMLERKSLGGLEMTRINDLP